MSRVGRGGSSVHHSKLILVFYYCCFIWAVLLVPIGGVVANCAVQRLHQRLFGQCFPPRKALFICFFASYMVVRQNEFFMEKNSTVFYCLKNWL